MAAGAAGVTAYELACAGVPAALVPVAPRAGAGGAHVRGGGGRDHGADVAELVGRLADAEIRAGLAARGPANVDGYGAFRRATRCGRS